MMHRGKVVMTDTVDKLIQQFGSIEKAFAEKISEL
jgi:hypothetical protein